MTPSLLTTIKPSFAIFSISQLHQQQQQQEQLDPIHSSHVGQSPSGHCIPAPEIMKSSQSIPEVGLQATSSPPLHSTQDPQRNLAFPQPEPEDEDSKRLPRVPRATDLCPRPWTWEETVKWLDLWAKKRRPPTPRERADYDECDRQFNVFAIENPTDTEDDEEDSVTATVPVRTRRQRPLSPPRTPPHLRGSKLYRNRDTGPASRLAVFKVEKPKAKSRIAPRRPITRSQGGPTLSLDSRKGLIKHWFREWAYVLITYGQYLKNYVSLVFSVQHRRRANTDPVQG